MLRIALLAALVLLVPLAGAAVDPHPRASPTLTMDAPVTAFAMAAAPANVNAVSILAGRGDPDGASGETARLWRAWNGDGSEVRGRTADKANCIATPVVDQCLGNVVDVATSSDGVRLAIVARDDSDDGRLILSVNNGDVATLELSNEQPSVVAMSADGTRIAVGSRLPSSPETGRVRLYTWAGTGSGGAPTTSTWQADTDFVVTDIAIGADGRVSAAAGDRHYRFSAVGTSFKDDLVPTVSSVAFAGAGPNHWSVAGTSDGFVLLYDDGDDSANPIPYDQPAGTSAQTAVAITRDAALFSGGGADGIVRLFRNIDVAPGTYEIGATAALPGGITSLQFSTDGRYLVAAAGSATVLLRTSTSGISEVWRSIGTGAVLKAGVNADGSVVASATGNVVTVFTTVHGLTVTPPAATEIEPGAWKVLPLSLRNTGNREATVTLTASRPTDWSADLSVPSITLAPNGTAVVNLNVSVPAFASPGAAAVSVTHTVQGQGIPVITAIPVSVAQVKAWSVASGGALSRGIEAGGSVQFELQVVNLGNGDDTTTVTATVDRAGWTAKVAPADLSASKGVTKSATLTIEAPSGLGNGETAKATVRLGSDPTASLQVTATVGARFGAKLVPVPAESDGARGLLGTFILRVTNTGNAPDSFTVTAGAAPAGWLIQVGADPLESPLAAGASVDLPVQVTPAVGAAPANYELAFTARSLGDNGKTAAATHMVHIAGEESDSESSTKKGGKGSPSLETGLLVAAIALALVMRRRR